AGSLDALGLLRMVCELLDNSVDEVVDGHASHIEVRIDPDGVVMVRDNGRGIPVDWHLEENKAILEWILTDPTAWRTFDSNRHKTASLGLSLGLATVNALSEWMRVEVRQEGKVYAQQYQRGLASGPLEIIGEDPTGHGTAIHFKVDSTIFG